MTGALGVLSAAYVWGWGGAALGASRAGPITPFIPVMVFAILFGLSTDYEVFLVSRIREEWLRTGGNTEAVRRGLAITGRTITAAAAIMIVVFGSFIFGGNLTIKEFGLALSVAVFVDAFIIRMVIVPALMFLLGRANWWVPGQARPDAARTRRGILRRRAARTASGARPLLLARPGAAVRVAQGP